MELSSGGVSLIVYGLLTGTCWLLTGEVMPYVVVVGIEVGITNGLLGPPGFIFLLYVILFTPILKFAFLS